VHLAPHHQSADGCRKLAGQSHSWEVVVVGVGRLQLLTAVVAHRLGMRHDVRSSC
jgi:hypothetical protein